MTRSKWLRLNRRLSERVDDLGGMRTHVVTVGPAQYLAMSWVGEYYPRGVFRSIWAGRVGLLWGPGHGTVENVPDGVRERTWWLRGGAFAVVLCLAGEGNGDA